MEENVALDSSKQHQFIKSIKGIKRFMKKKSSNVEKVTTVVKPSINKHQKKAYQGKGLVYLSHIPHGFYEHQMTQYFKQFGRVTNARVIRSKKTGASKGCAFVEFGEPSVAQIVAETMNNYLMGKRLLKAVYIPPEKQRRNVFRKKWSTMSNPGLELRKKLNQKYNRVRTESEEMEKARKLLKTFMKTKRVLSGMGIDYGFFQPVDVPDFLEARLNIKTEGTTPKAETLETNEKPPKTGKEINKKEKKIDKNVTEPLVKIKNKSVVKKDPEITQKVAGNKKSKLIPLDNFITLKKDEHVAESDADEGSDFDLNEFLDNDKESSDDLTDDEEVSKTNVNRNRKNKQPKQTPPQVIKISKTNRNVNVNETQKGEASVLKKSRRAKRNKKPSETTANKRKAEEHHQSKNIIDDLSGVSKKKKKSKKPKKQVNLI